MVFFAKDNRYSFTDRDVVMPLEMWRLVQMSLWLLSQRANEKIYKDNLSQYFVWCSFLVHQIKRH